VSRPEDEFQAAIKAAGLIPPGSIIADGAIHRFSTNGKRGDVSGWYVLHSDGIVAGAFGCWRSGLQSTWSQRREIALSLAEQERQRRLIWAKTVQQVETRSRFQFLALGAAAAQWRAAKRRANHPYATAKGVGCHGTRVDGNGCLLVPMRDSGGTLYSLQKIAPDGTKRFMSGGRVKGCFHLIGDPAGTLVVCEGYATGATIHEATGHAVAVAFNAGNLIPVSVALRARHATDRIIVAADDDWLSVGNTGCAAAKQAALASGGFVAVPWFPCPRPDKATDFNDLHALRGPDAVRACFDEIEEATC
jgi:putative DNA primase/helicase